MFIIFRLVKKVVLFVFWITLLVLLFSSRCTPEDYLGFLRSNQDESPLAAIPLEQAAPYTEPVTTYLEKRIGASVDEIEITRVEPRIWPDTCLGIKNAGNCDARITKGAKVWTEVKDREFVFHVSEDGRLLLAD